MEKERERAGKGRGRMQRGGEAAAEAIVWCANVGSQVIGRKTMLLTGSSAMCANGTKGGQL